VPQRYATVVGHAASAARSVASRRPGRRRRAAWRRGPLAGHVVNQGSPSALGQRRQRANAGVDGAGQHDRAEVRSATAGPARSSSSRNAAIAAGASWPCTS
jgi:hypothetical protein